MSRARETLSRLRRLGATITVEAGRLSVRAPKGVLTATLRDELALHKAEILELLSGAQVDDRSAPPLVRAPDDGPAPLSFAQQRLWFLAQLAPDNSSYNLGRAVRLRGPLDPGALSAGLDALARRHAILRSTFVDDGGIPRQVVGAPAPVPLASSDLSDLPAGTRCDHARALIEDERRRPFRLDRECPWRVSLYRLDDDDHVVLLVLHHIGGDASSLDILGRELSLLLDAARAGTEPALAELPLRYADHARWERAPERQALLDDQLAFWTATLAGAPPLELPTDRPRPPAPSFVGGREVVHLDESLVQQLQVLGRQAGASLYMTLLAGFSVLLGRYSGQTDVVVGSPAGNRNRTELEGLVGCFMNMLTLRTDTSGDPGFRALLDRIRSTCLSAYQHQDMPYERLVDELVGERDLSRNPLFSVFFALQSTPDELLAPSGCGATPFDFEYGTTDLDLDVFVSRVADGLDVSFLYSTDLFDGPTVRSMVDAYRALLQAAVQAPDDPISRLPLEDASSGPLVLRGPPGAAPDGVCIHQLFEARARATPHALAIRCEQQQLTYAELDARADALAQHLRSLGLGPEQLVGLAVERGLDLLVGVLGILKAGGAYVPLDPSFPPDRLAWILQDSRAALLVTQTSVAPGLPAFDGPVVHLDGDAWTASPSSGPAAGCEPSRLAYVIHTSGSTGRPKGVAVSHGAVVNFLRAMASRPGCSADDTLLAVTTLSFDIAGLELLLPLSVGGTVEIAPRHVASDGHRLAERLAAGGISLMQATPATWQMLLHAGWPGDPQLSVLCGGEELPRSLADALLPRCAALWNMYGPTETTIWSAVEQVGPGSGPVPLGQPIDHTWLLVLDEHMRSVPRGAPGELFIGGAGLARGYLNRPELTAERFVASSYPEQAPGRLYRTGDRVRLDAAGRLLFLGRTDTQVKLRGYRIELGEIEACLQAVPGVRRAVALVSEPVPGEQRLVAFWVGSTPGVPSAESLREHLGRALPAYMIPGALLPLEQLPLTPAGKTDRRQLAALVPADVGEPGSLVAPRGPVEAGVHAAFRELLGARRLGVHDGFFAAGGHSLLATRLVSRIRSTFGVELSLTQVFATPTVAGLARCIEALRGKGQLVASTPIPVVPRSGALALSFAQNRLWLMDQMGAGAGYHMRLELGLSGPLDTAALGRALDAVVARHETLRTRFVTEGGEPRQRIDPPAGLPLTVIDRPDAATPAQRDAVRHEHAVQDGARPFDLAHGPLLRAALLRCAGDHAVLVLAFHHVVADGRSYELLAQEIAAHYRAFAADAPFDVPELPVQYADFAAWQRDVLTADALADQLAFWKQQLAGGLPPLELPTDRPRPPLRSFAGAAHSLNLGPELAGRLTALAREQDATLAMLCLAAFQTLLSRLSGQRQVVVGTPIANRTRPETEALIGFFVNSLVMRADLSDDPPFRELLARVRHDSLAAYDHQDLPFEQLVDELAPVRDSTRTPLFQVVFAMNVLEGPELDGAGLRMTLLEPEISVTRFDLELHLFEQAGDLQATFVYSTALFDPTTIERMARHYRNLLVGVVDAPQCPVSALPLVDADERRSLLEDTGGPPSAAQPACCLHQLVEEQRARHPHTAALVYHDVTLTYAELDGRANQLAHALRARGARRDLFIGLCVERGPDMVVGLLGILKSGAAYVPLDPAYPRERLAFMLDDSGLTLLVTQAALLDVLPDHGADVLCLDRDRARLDEQPTTPPEQESRPDDLAYAIYTSGSTGTPKAALLAHAGVCNVAREQQRAFGVGPGTRALQFSSLSFDAATFDVVMALSHGATLVLGDRTELLPGPDLAGFLSQHAIGIVTLPPTALAALPDIDLPDLHTITVAGEACSAELVRRWAPGRRFFNLYGPTETTIWATTAELHAGDEPHIGRPAGATRVLLLDEHMGPVPDGVPGELCIGGVGVARGYLGRPELTAERFVDGATLSPDAPARLYRTGDLARRRPDGNLEFLGRLDTQVKLRGHRIEPGEIESVLDELPEVRQSLVMLREDAPGERRLVAYVVHDGDSPQAGESEHVAHWRALYEQSYGEAPPSDERDFNITSWDSSYTGQPLPADEMRLWLDHTVDAVLATRPERVLEIGCGMGLILFRVAPHCSEYLGTDLSQAALDYVQAQLDELPDPGASAVRLARRPADDLSEIPDGTYDTVVLNSVAQYFPGIEYLAQVLDGALRRLRPGGRLFVGDVRSLPLMAAFHTSIQVHQAHDDTPVDVLADQVRQRMDQDQELLVDPAFFSALRERVPDIAAVTVEPKRGRYDNELSRFRYDVTITRQGGDVCAAPSPSRWLTWGADVSALDALKQRLVAGQDDVLGVRGVTNGRTARDVAAVALLAAEHPPSTVAALRAARDALDPGASLDPDDLRELCAGLPYACEVSWAGAADDGSFDVVFRREQPAGTALPAIDATGQAPAPGDSPPARRWADYGNQPLRATSLRDLVPRLRHQAQQRLPEFMVPAAFVVLDAFPVTPNGKLDRAALPPPGTARPELAQAYQAPRSATERLLAEVWARTLGSERVGIHDDFFELGGDSILAIHVVASAREAGVVFSAQDIFQQPTVAGLAALARHDVASNAEQGLVTGALPLTPIQHWFFELPSPAPWHFNQAVLLEPTIALDEHRLAQALELVCEHHDGLRLRFDRGPEGWSAVIAPKPGAVPLEVHDLAAAPADERAAHIERETARIQAGLELSSGVLLSAALFRGVPGGSDTLLLVVHHLAVDAVSWGPLLSDLGRALEHLAGGEPPASLRLPPKTTSLVTWAEALETHARSPTVTRQAEHWLGLPWNELAPLPTDRPPSAGANTVGALRVVETTLDRARTQALQAAGATLNELLLTALARTLAAASGRGTLLVDLEGHGRQALADHLDVSRTVGWFTSIHPLLLRVDPRAQGADSLASVAGQLAAIPDQGRPFGLARYLAPDTPLSRRLAALPRAEIAFNYLGAFEQALGSAPFRWLGSPNASSRSPAGQRAHLLEIAALVTGGELVVSWGYCPARHDQATIEGLARDLLAQLDALIDAEPAPAAPDGSAFGWSDDDMADLLAELPEDGGEDGPRDTRPRS